MTSHVARREPTCRSSSPLGTAEQAFGAVLLGDDDLLSTQGRDQEWAAMYTVAERMTAKYERPVEAVTRHRGIRVTQGLALKDSPQFEPVRQRRMFSRRCTRCSRWATPLHGWA